MRRKQFKAACALVLLASLTVFLSLRRMNGQIQAENHQLTEELREQADPPGSKAGEAERTESDKSEAQRLRQDNVDLYKLRNQVSQLRGQLRELEAAKEGKARFSNSAPSLGDTKASFIAKAAWADAGLGSPEATIQTRYWALSQEQEARFIECMSSPAAFGNLVDQKAIQQIRNKMRDRINALKGYTIVATKQIDEDHVSVDVQEVSDRTAICTTTLARFGNDWKVTELRWYFGGDE